MHDCRHKLMTICCYFDDYSEVTGCPRGVFMCGIGVAATFQHLW